jgi:hypothetical protein
MKPGTPKIFQLSRWLPLIFVTAISLVVVGPRNATADRSIRCDGRLVSIGASATEVKETCGSPDNTEQWEEGRASAVSQLFDYESERYLAPRLILGPIKMERWTYNLGSNKFIRYLEFQNGKLIRIKTGDKGIGK